MYGYVEKRGKSSWRICIDCGVGEDTKRHRISKTVKIDSSISDRAQRKEAERIKERMLRELEALVKDRKVHSESGSMTLSEFSDIWLQDHVEQELKPRTIEGYKKMLNLRILPALGHIEIAQITPLLLNRFFREISAEGQRLDSIKDSVTGEIKQVEGKLSARTVKHHHAVLSSMLEKAMRWQLIPNNPAHAATSPRVVRPDVRILQAPELLRLINASKSTDIQHRSMLILAIFTGARQGEILSLQWKDIDLTRKTLSIVDSKTASGIRTIHLGKRTREMMSEYRAWQKCILGDEYDGLVFPSRNGGKMNPSSLGKWFHLLLERLALPDVVWHSLRHSAATLMLSHGVSDTTVSERIGHADPGTSKRYYAHIVPVKDMEAAELLETVVLGSDPKE